MSKSDRIRVMTVDDHEILRSGIRFSLGAFDDLELVGEAHSGDEALLLCEKLQPDVVLMDMLMPEMDGVDTTRAIRCQHPQVQVLVLTSFYHQDLVGRAMRAGAVGYLVKGVSADELAEAIRAAHAGRSTLSTEAVQALVQATDSAPKLGADLSDREREVLALLAEGLSNAEIAQRLTISLSTVKYHVHGILSKLVAASRAEAVALALQHDLIPKST
jgi:NarL family two-component system response regulator LiaR